MKVWQFVGGVSAVFFTFILMVANLDYLASLGSAEPFFIWHAIEITRKQALWVLAAAIDLAMIAALFAYEYQRAREENGPKVFAICVWALCCLFSAHSTKGWIATNISQARAPKEKAAYTYKSLQKDIETEQDGLSWRLQLEVKPMRRRDRAALEKQIAATRERIDDLRAKIEPLNIAQVAHPILGFEWYLAVALLVLNGGSWYAYFGGSGNGPKPPRRSLIDDLLAAEKARQKPPQNAKRKASQKLPSKAAQTTARNGPQNGAALMKINGAHNVVSLAAPRNPAENVGMLAKSWPKQVSFSRMKREYEKHFGFTAQFKECHLARTARRFGYYPGPSKRFYVYRENGENRLAGTA